MGILSRIWHALFPPPPPPVLLSGAWTPEERTEVIAAMYDCMEHRTQGRFVKLSPDDPSVEFYNHYRNFVRDAPAGELNNSDMWAYLKNSFSINALLPHEQTTEAQ